MKTFKVTHAPCDLKSSENSAFFEICDAKEQAVAHLSISNAKKSIRRHVMFEIDTRGGKMPFGQNVESACALVLNALLDTMSKQGAQTFAELRQTEIVTK